MAHKYCAATTANHTYSTTHKNCLQKIAVILANEGEKNIPATFTTTNANALNLDAIEKVVYKARQNPTCDFMIGVSNNGKDCKLMLLECKLNVKGKVFDRKLQSEIQKKEKYSKQLLGSSTPFWNCTYVLVKKGIVGEVTSNLRRLFRNRQPFKVLDAASLASTFF